MKNVSPFPFYKLNCVADAMEVLVHKIRADEKSAVRAIIIMETDEGNLDYCAFGEEPFTRAMAVGMCAMTGQEISDE